MTGMYRTPDSVPVEVEREAESKRIAQLQKVSEQEFSCVRDGLTIRGSSYRPQTEDRLPAVIVSHGFGGNRKELAEECRAIASWGYAVFSFDFCGGGTAGESDGRTTEMTVLTEKDDLEAVMDYVSSLCFVDAGRISLLGFSQGGFVSALTAAERPDQTAALILFFPALCIPDDARRGVLAFTPYDVNHVPDTIDCGGMVIGRRFHETAAVMDAYAGISRYGGPVLCLHGTADKLVDYRCSVRAKECYAPGQCHLELLKGAGHGFSGKLLDAALVSVRQFLLGKKEILTIDVRITGSVTDKKGENGCRTVFFAGSSESEYFRGTILPGAEDVQKLADGHPVSYRADYTLEGVDCEGRQCRIHIVNRDVCGEWKPEASTDSAALSFLNGADLTAVMESFEGGLTVRIFA